MEKLIKLEREIIKIGLSKDIFSYIDLEVLKSKYRENDIYLACLSLADRGYFDYKTFASGNIPVVLSLSNKGRHYFEHKRLDTIQFIKRSFICPICVSIVTTLFVLFLKSVI